MSAELNFIRQQGFPDATPDACGVRFPALMWQPRLVGLIVIVGIALGAPSLFLGLGALLWWNALLPRFNPFDHPYNAIVAEPRGVPALGPAPGPRRFAQGMAGTFMLAIGLSLRAGYRPLAWALEAALLAALGALLFGRFCLGSYLHLVLTGRASFAHRTLPWSPEDDAMHGRLPPEA